MATGSFPGVESARGVTLTPHPLLVPWSKNRAVHQVSLRAFVVCKMGETYSLTQLTLKQLLVKDSSQLHVSAHFFGAVNFVNSIQHFTKLSLKKDSQK
jgi:hypothetical protein